MLKIIILFISLFFIIQIPFLQKIPDYFQLIKIESPQSYLLRLLSIVIGFSSFILTTFLVIYNVFSKRLRRNSFSFIFKNPWINLIFSIFGGSLIFILFSIFIIQLSTENTITTLIYFSSFIAFGNLLLQFPLIILSIQHSNSFSSLRGIIANINEVDIEDLYNPENKSDDDYFIERFEKNNLIQIKDIGISAIKEDDWGIPQTILNDLFTKLILRPDLNLENIKQFNKYLFAYNFVSRHFQKVAIDTTDEITIKVALSNLFRTHLFFVEHNVRDLRNNPIDSNFQYFLKDISDNSALYSIQRFIPVNLVTMIGKHIASIQFSNEDLPTSDYIYGRKDFDYESKDPKISDYWFYIKNDLPNLFFDIMEYAIEKGNKTIYSTLNWQIHNLFDTISRSTKLTESQENDLFKEYSFKANKISDIAIQHQIFKNIEIYSYIQIVIWFEEQKKYAFSAFLNFEYMLHKLNKINNLSRILLDDYFMIVRKLAAKKN